MEQFKKLSDLAEEISQAEKKENQAFLIIAVDETQDQGNLIGMIKGRPSELVAAICVAMDKEPELSKVLMQALKVHSISKLM